MAIAANVVDEEEEEAGVVDDATRGVVGAVVDCSEGVVVEDGVVDVVVVSGSLDGVDVVVGRAVVETTTAGVVVVPAFFTLDVVVGALALVVLGGEVPVTTVVPLIRVTTTVDFPTAAAVEEVER